MLVFVRHSAECCDAPLNHSHAQQHTSHPFQLFFSTPNSHFTQRDHLKNHTGFTCFPVLFHPQQPVGSCLCADRPLSPLARAVLLQSSACVCQSKLHPRGRKATRICELTAGPGLSNSGAESSCQAWSRPMARRASLRGGSPEQNITNIFLHYGKQQSVCFSQTPMYVCILISFILFHFFGEGRRGS